MPKMDFFLLFFSFYKIDEGFRTVPCVQKDVVKINSDQADKAKDQRSKESDDRKDQKNLTDFISS